MKKKFYRCEICENIINVMYEGGGPLNCCGKPMTLLEANSTDAANEKHVPAVEMKGSKLKVQIGDVEHPMTDEHWIQWIAVVQGSKTQYVELASSDKPKATFDIDPDVRPIQVYEHCNLHRLWIKEID